MGGAPDKRYPGAGQACRHEMPFAKLKRTTTFAGYASTGLLVTGMARPDLMADAAAWRTKQNFAVWRPNKGSWNSSPPPTFFWPEIAWAWPKWPIQKPADDEIAV